ncbi:MAG: DUF2780 domain-containing protein [Steroidobacteraceae bacterium]|jgi:hypothetical protein|nr:DUF2780 domain-containing protein [Steroidobacteraceae bacterium]
MKELVELLVKTVGVDERQARGGAGVLLKAARDKLGPQEFGTMLGNLPGLDELIRQAPQPGGLGKLFGGLASTVGGGQGALVAGIVSGFGSLGLGTDHARRMAPVIMEFVRARVGTETADRLEKALRAGF